MWGKVADLEKDTVAVLTFSQGRNGIIKSEIMEWFLISKMGCLTLPK